MEETEEAVEEPTEEEVEEVGIDTVAVDTVLDDVMAGAQLYSVAMEVFQHQFIFQGKSLDAHSLDLLVHVPDNVTPDQLQGLFIKVSRKIQKASHFYAIANSANSAMIGGSNIRKSDIVAALVEDYRRRGSRRPAATVLERIAASYMKDTINPAVVAKIVKQFWSSRMEALIETRRCLEAISISIGTQMKYLDTE